MRSGAEAGQIVPFVAICLAVLLGVAGLFVDVGYRKYELRQQRAATEAAAARGAQQLAYSACPSNRVTTAVRSSAGAGCSVHVRFSKNNVDTLFTRLFGYSTVAETTRGVATPPQDDAACADPLSATREPAFDNGAIDAPGCSITNLCGARACPVPRRARSAP